MKFIPVILHEGNYSTQDISELRKKANGKTTDIYQRQVGELNVVWNPSKDPSFNLAERIQSGRQPITNPELRGDWIFFPWTETLIHTVNEEQGLTLRTNRNRNIISQEEQERLRDFTISIAGLSVGGNIATTLVYNGFPSHLKLADFDLLETTNLNRIRGKLADVGRSKLEIISEQLFELDPYIDITLFPRGINEGNLHAFLGGKPATKLVFEIIDDLRIKILLRLKAKESKIPLVMLTSIGDSVLIDVERYDTDPNTTPFNGLVDEKDINEILSGKLEKADENKYVIKIVGAENVPKRVLDSVREIGSSLVGRPQIMSTITVEAGIAAYLARRIVLGESVPSGRSKVKFEAFFKE